MEPLFEWDVGGDGNGERNLKALPYVIGWFGQAKEAVADVEESYKLDERKLSAIHQFSLAMPLLFEGIANARVDTAKVPPASLPTRPSSNSSISTNNPDVKETGANSNNKKDGADEVPSSSLARPSSNPAISTTPDVKRVGANSSKKNNGNICGCGCTVM